MNEIRRGLSTLLIAGAVICGLAVPSLAAADTFCVQPQASCSPANTHPTVQGALDAANGNGAGVRDTVLLGATTYSGNVVAVGDNRVDVVGQGTGQTTITSTEGFGTTVFSLDDPFSTISALTVQLPPTGNSMTGLRLTGDATGVAVTEPLANGFNFGVELADPGATLGNATVTMTQGGIAATSFSGGTVRDSELSGGGGFQGFGTVRRSSIASHNGAVSAQGGTTIENSLLRPVTGSPGFVGVSAISGSDSFSVDLRNVTIAGDGVAGQTGIDVRSFEIFGTPPAVSAAVTNTIIRGMDTDLNAVVNNGPGGGTPTAQISIQSSIFDPASTSTSGGGQIFPGPGNINADPLFADAPDGDYSLTAESPALDQGDNGFAPSGPDLAGAQRVADGDLDGEAVVDLGALEFNRATTITSLGAVAIPGVADPGEPVAFIADATDSDGAPLTYAWSFDDGDSGDGEVEIQSFQNPGTHTGTVTVTNPSGAQESATATVRIRAAEPPPNPTPTEPETPAAQCAGRDATAVGTSGSDVIRGTDGPDVIAALGGNDRVLAGKGRDIVCGGDGPDRLEGGEGGDKLFGEGGNDKLVGGPEKDRLVGGPGKDKRIP